MSYSSEPLHPPYGVVQPRQLVRWLDVNSQNGPLDRSRYDIVIPQYNINVAFTNLLISANWSGPVTDPHGLQFAIGVVNPLTPQWFYRFRKTTATALWGAIGPDNLLWTLETNQDGIFEFTVAVDPSGVPDPGAQAILSGPAQYGTDSVVITDIVQQVLPDIVCQFNYTAPSPFSLNRFLVSAIPNIGTVTISDINGRYRLNNDPYNPIFGYQNYTNQLLQSNFRIEIWASTNSVSNAIAYLQTTIKTNLDYRYNADTYINPTQTITVFPSIFPIT